MLALVERLFICKQQIGYWRCAIYLSDGFMDKYFWQLQTELYM